MIYFLHKCQQNLYECQAGAKKYKQLCKELFILVKAYFAEL